MTSERTRSIKKRWTPLMLAILAAFGLSTTFVAEGALAASDTEMSEEGAGDNADSADSADSAERAQPSRPLEPTYLPREPEKKSWYNSDYIFGMTRGLANSTIAPAGKAPLFIFTIPLDIVTLPFTVIGGFFG